MGYYLLFCLAVGFFVSQVVDYFYLSAYQEQKNQIITRWEKIKHRCEAIVGWPIMLAVFSIYYKEFPRFVFWALATWILGMFVVALVGFLLKLFPFWDILGYAAFASGIWFATGYIIFGFIGGVRDGALFEP